MARLTDEELTLLRHWTLNRYDSYDSLVRKALEEIDVIRADLAAAAAREVALTEAVRRYGLLSSPESAYRLEGLLIDPSPAARALTERVDAAERENERLRGLLRRARPWVTPSLEITPSPLIQASEDATLPGEIDAALEVKL